MARPAEDGETAMKSSASAQKLSLGQGPARNSVEAHDSSRRSGKRRALGEEPTIPDFSNITSYQ